MSKLYFRYGAMNSGKSSHLLQVAHNYEEQGMNILLIKPFIDTKGKNNVVSRLGIQREADYLLGRGQDLTLICVPQLKAFDCILVDEAQFLTIEQVDQLYWISKMRDVPVICYGLRCDFQMKGFPGATRLLEIADDIEELKTICKCGKKATQNMRYVNGQPVFDGEQVCIDNQDGVSYEAVCGKCYLLKRGKLYE